MQLLSLQNCKFKIAMAILVRFLGDLLPRLAAIGMQPTKHGKESGEEGEKTTPPSWSNSQAMYA